MEIADTSIHREKGARHFQLTATTPCKQARQAASCHVQDTCWKWMTHDVHF
jgi:hypothetical protein